MKRPRPTPSTPPAIVLGGSANAVSVARSLGRAGIAVHAVGSALSPVRYSRYCRSFTDLGTGVGVQKRWLDWLVGGPIEAVLLPCDDDGLELVARHRAELVALGYTPIEADDDVLLAMLDKERTYDLARAAGVETPWSLTLRSVDDLDAVFERATYPCVLKPVRAHEFRSRLDTVAKVLIADDRPALRLAIERTVGVGVDMMVTERIPGGDDQFASYYSYLDADGRPLLHFNRHKQRQYPVGFGMACYATNRYDREASELGLRFFQAVGVRGLVNVEFKRDARDGRLKLIECNHRFTAGDRHLQLCGLDLPLFTYSRLMGRELPPVSPIRSGMYMWHPIEDVRAYLALRASDGLPLGEWARSVRHRPHFPVAEWRDPMPTVGYHARLLGRAVRKLARANPGLRPARRPT